MLDTELKTVEFGKYKGKPIEWYVVEEDETQQVLLTKKCIEQTAFNQKVTCDYMQSDIRKFLLKLEKEAFTAEEQEKLIVHEKWQDKVFIMQEAELMELKYKYLICNHWYWTSTPASWAEGQVRFFGYSGGGSFSYGCPCDEDGGVRCAIIRKRTNTLTEKLEQQRVMLEQTLNKIALKVLTKIGNAIKELEALNE